MIQTLLYYLQHYQLVVWPLVGISVAMGLFLCFWAERSGKSPLLWLMFGFLLAPVALIAAVLALRMKGERPITSSEDEDETQA